MMHSRMTIPILRLKVLAAVFGLFATTSLFGSIHHQSAAEEVSTSAGQVSISGQASSNSRQTWSCQWSSFSTTGNQSEFGCPTWRSGDSARYASCDEPSCSERRN